MCDNELTPEKWASDLLQKRTIYLSGNVTSDRARDLGKAIVWLNTQSVTEPITFYIDSSGGSTSAGLDMYDIVNHSTAPVTGIVYRQASSAAAIVLQACKIRQALPNSVILVHSLRLMEFPLCEIEEDMEKALEEARRLQKVSDTILQLRTGLPLETIKKMNRKNKSMTAQEALAIGLIDEIIGKV